MLMHPIGAFTWGAALNFLLGFSILAWSYKISTQTRFGYPYSEHDSSGKKLKYFISSPVGIMIPVLLMGLIGLVGNSVATGGWNIATLSFPGLHGLFGIVVFIAALGVSLAIMFECVSPLIIAAPTVSLRPKNPRLRKVNTRE